MVVKLINHLSPMMIFKGVFLITYVIENATPPKNTKFTVVTVAGFAFNKYENVMYINGE